MTEYFDTHADYSCLEYFFKSEDATAKYGGLVKKANP
jgi:hypothetical protein